ncbi:MAG TPA: hypothetical protein VHP31_11865 [Caproicibacter sp.]|nr:hypothetical protein [Caproicibacter sp.]
MNAKEFLKQHDDWVKEMDWIDEQLEKLRNDGISIETDCVVGSSRCEPYQKHAITITGAVQSKKTIKARQHLFRLYDDKKRQLYGWQIDAEKLLDKIADSRARRIFRFYYIDGLTWDEVAAKMGHDETKDGVRIYLDRIMKKIS